MPLDAIKEAAGAKNEGLTLDGYVPVQLAFGWIPRSWDAFVGGVKDNIDNVKHGRGQDVVQQALLQRVKAGIEFRKTLISDGFRRVMNKYQSTKYIKNPTVGMQVDIWRQKAKKDEGGYQGPAIITDVEQNKVTLRRHGQQISASRDQLREHREAILCADHLAADHMLDNNNNIFITIPDNNHEHHHNSTTANITTSINLDHDNTGTTANTSNNHHHDTIATTSEEAQLTTTHETIKTTMPMTITTDPMYDDDLLTYEAVVYMAQKNYAEEYPNHDTGSCFVAIFSQDHVQLPEGCGVHFFEAFSGEAVPTARAKSYRFLAGEPADYRTGWNLRLKAHRLRLTDQRNKMKPFLMTFAFNCGPWFIAHTVNLDRRELLRNEERPVLKFVAERREAQDDEQRLYLLENPQTSKAWEEPPMTRLQKRKSHRSTTLHMCRYELRGKD